MKKIAVTGNLSVGKTTVCQILQSLGAVIVSSDNIAHQLLSANSDPILDLCGKEVLTDGTIDRKKVADLVFDNPEKLIKLEEILHTQVLEEIQSRYEQAQSQPDIKLFVAEVPLLFEVHWEKFFDATICVTCIEKQAQKRYLKEGHSLEDYQKRMKRLLPQEVKQKRSDFVIENNNSEAQLINQTTTIFNQIVE